MSGDYGSSEPSGNGCYAGYLGWCSTCDYEGSCICGKLQNGMSDFFLMDRSRWDEAVIVCPVFEPLLIGCYALLTLFALHALYQVVGALRVQAQIAFKRRHRTSVHVPLVVMSGALLAGVAIVCYASTKIIFPEAAAGIHPAVSIILWVKGSATSFTGEAHLLHMFSVALSTQEASLGRQRVAEAIQHKLRKCILKSVIYSLVVMTPLVECICVATGETLSTEALAAFAVSYNLCEAARIGSGGLLLRIEARQLLLSFERSIEAAQAGIVVAGGGAAHLPSFQAHNAALQPDDPSVPQYLQPLLKEHRDLKEAHANIQTNVLVMAKSWRNTGIYHLVLVMLAPTWNKLGYFIALQMVGYTYIMRLYARVYGAARRHQRAEGIVQQV